MKQSMRYTDRRGRRRTLTRQQFYYLDQAARGPLQAGWGGMDSTKLVRLLESRGLIMLERGISDLSPRWTIRALTQLGQTVLAQWKEAEEARNT